MKTDVWLSAVGLGMEPRKIDIYHKKGNLLAVSEHSRFPFFDEKDIAGF